jgi:hypothetical protein
MSSTVALRYLVTLTVGGKERVWSQPANTPTIVLDNDPSDYVVPVAALATAVLWNPTLAGSAALPSSFKFLMLVSDEDVVAEFTTNEGDANEKIYTVTLAANIPFILGEDASYYDYTTDPFTQGTLDVIDKIRATNLSSDTDALVQVVLGT